MKLEDFFDLRIATVAWGEAAPPDADWVRVLDPARAVIRAGRAAGWNYKPCYVMYVLPTPVSVEAYIEGSFRSGTRNKPRKLLREVPKRYALSVEHGDSGLEAFKDLYRRTIVARPRGRDRVAEHEEGFDREWRGFYLREKDSLVAGILVHDSGDHLSVGYGAFDPAHRALDLEHYLIMQVIDLAARRRAAWVSLGMDTNRYGHHLPLGLPAYKLRIGFTPVPCEPAGRELLMLQGFDRFESGLFFYTYAARGLEGNLFTRGEPDLRPFAHHNAPPLRVHRIPC